jgi:dipeptidyl aminopeptidase/acylaminoacyl peptidase
MKPTDLHLFRALGRPAPASGGEVFVALSTPDLVKDRYQGVIWRAEPGVGPVEFTHGPRDSAPVLSPDGETIVFLRAGESGPAQPYGMPRSGGEPRKLAEHPLGVSGVVFSPDSRRIAYLAALPEPGRYGTARSGAVDGDPDALAPGSIDGPNKPAADAEAPRRLNRMSYRADGKGFLVDKPEQIFVLELAEGARPRQVTTETETPSGPSFTPDGTRLVYVRRSAPDALTDDLVVISADADEPGTGEVVLRHGGGAGSPSVAGDTVYYVGTTYQGTDFAGRCPGLWAVPLAGGEPRRLTDPDTVHVDAMAGEPAVVGDHVLVAVDDRGAVGIRAVPRSAELAELATLPEVVGGRRVVKSFTVAGSRLAAVVATPESTGDVVTLTLAGDGGSVAGDSDAPAITDVSAPLRAAGIGGQVELTGSAPDGYPVHGWLVLPPGDGPHPVLLAVHGGPHSAYGWGIFDEAQMYAAHGYAVVLANPRGSAGYGERHGRAIVGALGTVDADDLLALLDVALGRDDCDAGRVGVMGGSYGGFMTSWLASHAPGRFVAAISERAVNAWDSFAGSSDIGYFFAAGYVGADRDAQWAASPLAYADRIDIPFLVVHSEQDWRCPIEQGQRLFVALKLRGHEAEMLVFPGEGHELSRTGKPQHRRQRFEAILSWWARHLPVASG